MKDSSQTTNRRLIFSITVLSIFAFTIYFLAVPQYTADAKKKSKSTTMLATSTFPTSTALPLAIPDNDPVGVDLSIPVAGLTDEVRGVALNITFDQPAGGGGHTWVGDLITTLSSPAPANTHTIFARTGSTTPTGAGDSSDAQGPYTFTDGTTGDWWAVAVATVGGTIPAGSYRTHAFNSATPTDMNPVFQGPALMERVNFDKKSPRNFDQNPIDNLGNGTWTLTVSDNAGGDTGRVAALSLTVTTLAPTAALASIRGSVLSPTGKPVSRASVTIFDTSTGESLTAITNQFGYFRFEELPVGHFYTMEVQHREFQFEPQSFTLSEDRQAEFRSNK